ncbi:hypothetical protein [Thauera sp.]|uniref:hypothetical protein n=1 Tax=Thauera sp. TaxID=1905334 RepID=UPI0039E6000C
MNWLSDKFLHIGDRWTIEIERYTGTSPMNQRFLSTTGNQDWAIASGLSIACLDLAQNADYPPSLRQSHAPNRLESRLTHCRGEIFSLAHIFCLSQTRTKPIETGSTA